jgi:mRNA interferase MazF
VICDRYDTIVVPFPFADVPVIKRRPVIVLSGPMFNSENGASIVAMITTAKASTWPSDVRLDDLETAGLRQPCIIRWRLATIPNALIANRLGQLSARDRLACELQFTALTN